ncbi:hypothetical protein [Amycolatopsis rifamycinica]|uniref:Uncharacterized protein n=1 Tax=Amycolatopsis rifamycinica TaxID=287986 RepID=A0A066U8S5_9PSEU|nr:hypothetical protein [Amycolatopsis rifamycinica]KDN20613.1 hypothetical protein DV20_19565 [Amycolatopsis rifamycinica]
MPRSAALAWWGATACWFLGTLAGRLTGRHTAITGAVPLPVAVLVFALCAGFWAALVQMAYRGVHGARAGLAVAGALGVVNLVVQLAGDVIARDVVHGGLFLAALVLSAAGLTLMARSRFRTGRGRRSSR